MNYSEEVNNHTTSLPPLVNLVCSQLSLLHAEEQEGTVCDTYIKKHHGSSEYRLIKVKQTGLFQASHARAFYELS